jgi:hypothetical protein
MSSVERTPKSSEHGDQPFDFARDAAVHGILHSPDIFHLRNLCIDTEFNDEIGYQQGVLTLLHACDMVTQDNLGNTELRGIAFCLADVHYRTEHYEYCLGELKFIQQNLILAQDETLLPYVQDAIEHVGALVSPDASLAPSPVRTEILYN